jgi:ABC-type branched-subunit amino acid transport system substrate-binding protein
MRTWSLIGLGATAAIVAVIVTTDRASISEPRSAVAPYGHLRPAMLRFQSGVDPRHRTIALGVLSDLTGPQAELGRAITAGQRAYWRGRNRAGGVRGWRVRLLIRDTKDQPRRHQAALIRMLPTVAAIQQSFGYPTTRAILHVAATRKLLVATAAAQESTLFGQPNLMLIGTPYSVAAANAVDELATRTPNARTALVYEDNAIGRDGLAGYAAGVAAGGVDDVGRISVSESLRGVAERLAGAGAQAVIVSGGSNIAEIVIAAADRIGYRPRWIFQDTAWKASRADELLRGGARVWVLDDSSSRSHSAAFNYGYAQAAAMAAVLARAISVNDLTPRSILDAKLTLGRIALPSMAAVRFTPFVGPPTRSTAVFDVRAAGRRHWRLLRPLRSSAAARNLRFTAAGVLRPRR